MSPVGRYASFAEANRVFDHKPGYPDHKGIDRADGPAEYKKNPCSATRRIESAADLKHVHGQYPISDRSQDNAPSSPLEQTEEKNRHNQTQPAEKSVKCFVVHTQAAA